jgi:hypothetical protein
LVRDPNGPHEVVEVFPNGERRPCAITHEDALAYATETAKAFGVGESQAVPFDSERAKLDVKGEGETKTRAKRGGKKSDATESQ